MTADLIIFIHGPQGRAGSIRAVAVSNLTAAFAGAQLEIGTKTLAATLARGIKVHEEVDHFRRVALLRSVAQFLSHTGKLQRFSSKNFTSSLIRPWSL
jgi:hypothetical protein